MARTTDLRAAAALVAMLAATPASAFDFQAQLFSTAYNRLARKAGVQPIDVETCPYDANKVQMSCIYDVGPYGRLGVGTITVADGVFYQERAQSVTLRFKAGSLDDFETSLVLAAAMSAPDNDGTTVQVAIGRAIGRMAGLGEARDQVVTLGSAKIAVSREPTALVAVITDTAYRERTARE